MKKCVLVLLTALALFPGMRSISQDLPFQKGLEPASLTPDELFVLSRVPKLKLPESYKGSKAPLMPSQVDNSTQPFFRPITAQSGYECGQSAGISFNFTYEIDRLRGLAANQTTTQYPSHFTWDFLNNANNYQGASFFDSWEIVRACGNMNISDYGGAQNTGGYTRWISGYDMYYNGMHNRINSVKAIRVDTPDGLQTLKYWLLDHLEGASVGGVANMYGQYFGTPSTVLPPNTPYSGQYVQPFWGSSPSHAWTICGYNDSIRYDFNNDGQYTNNIDINGDGVVDMHDWEIGGLKFANGYAGPGWSNSGFCYTMYKNLADNSTNGGIWNHTVYVLDVKSTCSPVLTMKVTLKHTSRNKIKVTAGLNTDLAATVPSATLEFPIFNNQGGDLYMQGGATEADKTIEFGLDLAPLISQIANNMPAKYFLQVQETDPANAYTGEIVGWSLVDYTPTTPIITNYPVNNVALVNNDITRLSMNYTLGFNKPYITIATLPPAQLYQPYSATLAATGGTPPYKWDARLDYPETVAAATFPSVTAQQLTLTNNNTGYAVKTLDFNFPFYKKFVSKLYIYADGYILFDDQPYTWPYIIDKMLLFKQTAILAPFMTDLAIYPAFAQGVWFEGNANYAVIRWKASLYNLPGGTSVNFAVKIYPNGTIEYYYGDMLYPAGTAWTGGMSSGDNKNFQFSVMNSAPAIAGGVMDKFTTCSFPPEMDISEDGHFTGTPTNSYQNLPIKFVVTDLNNISSSKTLLFNSFGLLITQTIVSGGDSLIEFGETADISLNVVNVGSQVLHNVSFWITKNDPWITLTDSTENVAIITGGQNLNLPNAFSFVVSPQVPDNHPFTIMLHVLSQEGGFQRPIDCIAHAPVFHVTGTQLLDGDNGLPDPGESADLQVTYRNDGSAKASFVNVHLTTADTNLTINAGSAGFQQFRPDSSRTLTFHVTAGNQAPSEHLYKLKSTITANNSYSGIDTVYLFSGQIVEDFETGNFNKFPWYASGQWPWRMETGVKYEGNYCALSGLITDNAESVLNLAAMVLTDGDISFYKMVSCEQDPSGSRNYDYMAFQIDNFEMGRWDGTVAWSKETYHVAAGYHTFSWIYHKNGSVAAGMDGCLVDFITLPLIEAIIPSLSVTPASFEKTIAKGESVTDSIHITNTGGGMLKYNIIVFDTAANKKAANTDNLTASFVSCSATGFTPAQAINWLFTVHNQSTDNEYIKQVKLDFPPGVMVTGATNFSGGSLGDLVFQGTPGNGASLHWHGESAGGLGVLKPGETAVATITGTIGKSFTDDVFVVYDLRGDSSGVLPHEQPGSIKVTNQGLPDSWITLANPAGSLFHGHTGTVALNIHTASLAMGTYHCKLVAGDFYNNKVVIPVTLHVWWPLSAGNPAPTAGHGLKPCFPDPFTTETTIPFDLEHPGEVRLAIYSAQGLLLRSWQLSSIAAGEHSVIWDGRDDNGHQLAPGVYTCRMNTRDYQGSRKLILIR
ncbi:MAG: FlgD immunoglobulin-like domain containing protein [Bacteroidota bacterium]